MIIDKTKIKTIDEALAAIDKLEVVVTDTQKYVGQLERGEVKGKGTPTPTPTPNGVTSDPEYLRMKQSMAERNMRDDKKDAEVKLRAEYSDEVYDILSPKFDVFAKEQIRAEASTVQFFTSCFELIFAREMKDKESDLFAHYKIKKPAQVEPPKPGETTPPITGETPPPPITAGDPAGGNPGGLPPIKAENTGEAFNSLEKTLAGLASNPYDK